MTPSLPPNSIPNEAFFGSAHSYLETLPREHKQVVGVMILRTLSAIRVSSVGDADLLRACAQIENKLLSVLAAAAVPVQSVRVAYDP